MKTILPLPFCQWWKRMYIFTGLLLLMVSCKKDRKEEPPVISYEDQRIASIRNKIDGETTSFSYDNEKRLTRIDYNNSYDGILSLRFEYTLPTITATYYKGAAPDPNKEKYSFTVLNGRVENCRMTKKDGTIYDTYYEYDDAGRMIEAGHRGISSGGSLFMTLDCYFTYNLQNNTQEIELYGTRISGPTDTVVFTRTFDPQKNYFTFHNIGFNFFGSFSTGITYKVAGINDVVIPFPFFISRPMVGNFPMVPAKNAMKLLKGKGTYRDFTDIFNNTWRPVLLDREYPDDHYKYDEMGRLIEERNIYLFNWK